MSRRQKRLVARRNRRSVAREIRRDLARIPRLLGLSLPSATAPVSADMGACLAGGSLAAMRAREHLRLRRRELARYAQARRSERDRLRSASSASPASRTVWCETVAWASKDARHAADRVRTLSWGLASDGRIAPRIRAAIAREIRAWAHGQDLAVDRRHPAVVVYSPIRHGGSCLDPRTRTVSVRPGGAHGRLARLARLAGDALFLAPDLRADLTDTTGEGAESVSDLYARRALARAGHARAASRAGLDAWASLLVADCAPKAALWEHGWLPEPVPASHGRMRVMDVTRHRRGAAAAWSALCAAGLSFPFSSPKASPAKPAGDTRVARPAKLADRARLLFAARRLFADCEDCRASAECQHSADCRPRRP